MIPLNDIIPQVLDTIGQDLEFVNSTIKGFIGFQLASLQEGTTKQTFSFNVHTQDVVDNNIVEDDEFLLTTEQYVYTFKVNLPPVDIMNGWSRIDADFISKEII